VFELRDDERRQSADPVGLDARRHRIVLAGAALIGLGIGILMGTVAHPPKVRLLWNASASAPVGLYLIKPGQPPEVGDMIAARAPDGARQLAATRGYLPSDVPLVKQIAATKGSQVCAMRAHIIVDGRTVARRRKRDAQGREMPWWSGCRWLQPGEVLLLNRATGSFDSRYFGPVERVAILGKAVLLWPL
jgi:conjugative transfer signal peptidase TraF